MKSFLEKTTTFHFAAVCLFLFALSIRLMAVSNIHLTNTEALTLFAVSGRNSAVQVPFLQQFITRLIFLFFGNKAIYARWITAILGSMLAISPVIYRGIIGTRASLLMAFFFALDPFFIANSVLIHGHHIQLLIIIGFVGYLIQEKFTRSAIFLLLLIFSGYIATSLLLILFVLLLLRLWNKNQYSKKLIDLMKGQLEVIQENRLGYLLAVMSFLIVSVLMKIDLSSVLSDLRWVNFSGWPGYALGKTPGAFIAVFLSYLPMLIFIFPSIIIYMLVRQAGYIHLLLVWIVVIGAALVVNPYHRFIDLIWIALPIWAAFSILVDKALKKNPVGGITTPTIIGLMVILVSTFFSALSIVNRIGYGGAIIEQVLLTIILLTVFLIFLILHTYWTSLQTTAAIAGCAVFFAGILIQLAISARSAGINHRPQYELLWEGYFTDADLLIDLAENSRSTRLGTKGSMQITMLANEGDAQQWLLEERGFQIRQVTSLQSLDQPIIISAQDQLNEVNGNYFGQRFVANSQPLWILSPLQNLFTPDYWSWFFFRQSQLFTEYNYFWAEPMGG